MENWSGYGDNGDGDHDGDHDVLIIKAAVLHAEAGAGGGEVVRELARDGWRKFAEISRYCRGNYNVYY